MIDPITAFTAASAAFSGLKKAIAVGKDITSMGNTLSTWSKAVADMDFLEQKAKKPPMYKMFTDTQASALDIWTKKQKLKERFPKNLLLKKNNQAKKKFPKKLKKKN